MQDDITSFLETQVFQFVFIVAVEEPRVRVVCVRLSALTAKYSISRSDTATARRLLSLHDHGR